ncbi:MAG: type B 50S ribosomal protein L31 [Puniceicoccales bacterium]|jgi:large subunit ribosomal protein L31|nr:type B 50S ribosomal protein L31 [Puniceicoccales bacterium]
MKKGIHPELHPVCYEDVSTGKRFFSVSTARGRTKETIGGVECSLVHRDVTADSHPAYTGIKRFVDTAGRVEKFEKRFARRRQQGGQ